MERLKKILPHLSISLDLVLMIVIYLDLRNPMMGFLVGAPFLTLAASACICSIISCVLLIAKTRKSVHSEEIKQ